YSDPQGQSMMGVARLVPSAGWVIVAGVSMKEALGDFVKTGVLESVLSFFVASAAFAVLNMLSIDREKRLLRLTASELETQNSDIARLNRLLTVTREVNQLMSHDTGPPELLDRVCQQLVGTCGFRCGWILLLEGSSLRLGAEAGVPLGMLSTAVPLEDVRLRCACFVAAIEERHVVYMALQRSELCTACKSRTNCPAGEMLVVPIMSEGDVYGVLVVRSGTVDVIGKEERDSMEGLANDIAFAISMQAVRRQKQVAEDALLQAQKMEAVGQLAGGVAHDFNNLLTGIAGNIDLALDEIPVGSETARSLTDAMKAAHKAADLTRSLLTFSRKAMVVPTVADVNKIIDEVLTLLARSLPPSIRIARHPSIDVWPVRVDTSQIAQVLVNLAINARDAMHGEGTLTITAANQYVGDHTETAGTECTPGEYVGVTVSDTGDGMTAEVQKHLFEPFFTTKDVGKGTGLGLSIAYGAVKQAGGWIDVQSEPGQGSSLTVFLPRCTEHPSTYEEPKARSQELPKGIETILIVDDEESVRTLGKRILERFGYTVLSAASGAEACELFEKHHDTIDLVICDLTMPGMSGIDCVARLKRINPKALVLLSSGYTAEVAELSLLTRGPGAVVDFLAKPYTMQEMVTTVRRVLDASGFADSAAGRQRQPDAPH
ncbi:MAG: response regulator, partial [Caldisericota bacterium]|nr:response regulator [Caldisericota bacterium]